MLITDFTKIYDLITTDPPLSRMTTTIRNSQCFLYTTFGNTVILVPMSADIPLISLDQFKRLTKNKEQTLISLIQLTIVSFHEYKAQFEDSILKGDKKEVGELAHKIKMTLTLLEANELKQAIATSREILNQEHPDLNLLKDSIQVLKNEFDFCIEELEQHQKLMTVNI